MLAACEGSPGRDGFDGIETYWFVKTYTINSNDWQLINGVDQLGSYYQAKINIRELDSDFYTNNRPPTTTFRVVLNY